MLRFAIVGAAVWMAFDLLLDKWVADYFGKIDLDLFTQIADAIQKANGN